MSELQAIPSSPYMETPAIENDPRWIEVRVSRINLALTVGGALLAFPVLFIVSMHPWLRVGLLVTFAAAAAWDIYLILLKSPYSIRAFHLFELGAHGATPESGQVPRLGIRARVSGGNLSPREVEGVVLPKAVVSPWFTALRYRLPGDAAWRRWWPRAMPIWPDSIPAEDFRKIRVLLKWK